MEAKELRIGNYLQGKNIVKITKIFDNKCIGIGKGDPYYLGENPCLDPVTLTKDLMVKLGFQKFEGYWIQTFKHGIQIFIQETGTGKFRYQFDSWYKYLYSVHEIQNLVHSLVGEELKFKKE